MLKWLWKRELYGPLEEWTLVSGLLHYERVDDRVCLSVFGKEAFYRVGPAWSLFGFINGVLSDETKY